MAPAASAPQVKYDEFRTGLTFRDVFHMLAVEARGVFHSEGRRMFITRHTVLGRWRQIKLASWEAMQRSATRHHVVQQIPLGREQPCRTTSWD